MILNLFGKRGPDPVADLYVAITAEARRPDYFARMGVPDTVEGRFELLMLMTGLVLARLNGAGGPHQDEARRLSEAFFDDMDRTLREIGVGDPSMPKKMKKIAGAFFGRTGAYQQALGSADQAALERALRRNIYEGTGDEAFEMIRSGGSAPPVSADDVAALSVHVRRIAAALSATPAEAIVAGPFAFPAPDLPSTDQTP
ncbi:ubiquinol-cytochrome C chaperone family protein [Chthonobacter rhizosphaerae]|uniref:ubiquinol-cytochrome C chaperone family protein n=1 Tax=Chthonobacter rhizosphaerae TaxID=2735553 RepID=UPI0015EF22F2|nr:ubiquinol-cytochrome C chaperone family protein [Chthonobacter rhizosphaerae]